MACEAKQGDWRRMTGVTWLKASRPLSGHSHSTPLAATIMILTDCAPVRGAELSLSVPVDHTTENTKTIGDYLGTSESFAFVFVSPSKRRP